MTSAAEELENAAMICEGMRPSEDEAAFTAHVLEPLSGFLNADMGVFRIFSRGESGPVVSRVMTLGVPQRINDTYLARFSGVDPALHMSRHRFRTPLFSDGVESGGWRSQNPKAGASFGLIPTGRYRQDFLRYRDEFLLPNRLHHHLGFCFQHPETRCTFLFDFHRAAAPFERLEHARAKVVAMLLHARFSELSSDRDGYGRNAAAADGPGAVLTARESQVAQAVARGLSNKEIAGRMEISVRTVENHLRSIYAKTGTTTRTRLAALLHEARYG